MTFTENRIMRAKIQLEFPSGKSHSKSLIDEAKYKRKSEVKKNQE